MSRTARFVAATAAAVLASAAGAATVATFNYAGVNSSPTPTIFSETVTATDSIASLRMSGSLTEINLFTWGNEALINITAPDAQFLSIALFPAVQGFVGTLTATDIVTDFPVPVASAAGSWGVEFIEDYDDGFDGLEDAVWDSVQINLESEGAPPLTCPPGLGTPASFTNLISDDIPAAFGGVGNSIVTADFGIAGDINTLHITGDYTAFAPSWRYDCGLALTPPAGGGSYYLYFSPLTSAGNFQFVNDITTLAELQAGTGTWTIETFEDFEDGVTPDAIWDFLCITGDQAETTPFATDVVTPFNVARDGVQVATFEITVYPGNFPTSTGLTVVVDDTYVGGSGALPVFDDGNAPDLTAGDGIYTGSFVVPPATALGAATLPYVVADAETRVWNDALAFTVIEASGACCTDAGCVVTTIGDCVDVLGGTFSGTGTACGAPFGMATDGAGAFEDISATGVLVGLTGADDLTVNVVLPFIFPFFGTAYSDVNISSNGNMQFPASNSAAYVNTIIPDIAAPNNALYPMWDDFNLGVAGDVYAELLGTIGTDARFIVQWNGASQYGAVGDASTFQVVLFEDGNFEFRYLSVTAESVVGDTTTIGYEDSAGLVAWQSAETRDTLAASAPISFRGNSDVSDTGVCGNGCPPCAADYDNNGGVDGGDLGAFFADFEAGETCADVDQNGGVDGGDLGYFFTVFEAGGC